MQNILIVVLDSRTLMVLIPLSLLGSEHVANVTFLVVTNLYAFNPLTLNQNPVVIFHMFLNKWCSFSATKVQITFFKSTTLSCKYTRAPNMQTFINESYTLTNFLT